MKVLQRIAGVILFILWTVLFALTMLFGLFITPLIYIFRGANGVSQFWSKPMGWLNFLDLTERWLKA